MQILRFPWRSPHSGGYLALEGGVGGLLPAVVRLVPAARLHAGEGRHLALQAPEEALV